jgi:hypothetical protein
MLPIRARRTPTLLWSRRRAVLPGGPAGMKIILHKPSHRPTSHQRHTQPQRPNPPRSGQRQPPPPPSRAAAPSRHHAHKPDHGQPQRVPSMSTRPAPRTAASLTRRPILQHRRHHHSTQHPHEQTHCQTPTLRKPCRQPSRRFDAAAGQRGGRCNGFPRTNSELTSGTTSWPADNLMPLGGRSRSTGRCPRRVQPYPLQGVTRAGGGVETDRLMPSPATDLLKTPRRRQGTAGRVIAPPMRHSGRWQHSSR